MLNSDSAAFTASMRSTLSQSETLFPLSPVEFLTKVLCSFYLSSRFVQSMSLRMSRKHVVAVCPVTPGPNTAKKCWD